VGWLTLVTVSLITFKYVRVVNPWQPAYAWLAAFVMLLDYHLVWAALSGMETLLFGLIILILIPGREIWKYSDTLLGLLIGLSVWIRPDGLLLLFPVGLTIFATESHIDKFIRRMVAVVSIFLVLFIAYLSFNFLTAGSLWPSTFYAKQAEYASLINLPIHIRMTQLYSQPLIGVGLLLLPGFLVFGYRAVITRNWYVIAGYLWFIGFVGMYVFRLPVIYQHGRYIIPVVPLYLLYGLCGLPHLFDMLGERLRFILSRAWVGSLLLVAFGFWWWGGQAYALDVAIIEMEMVDTSKWIAANTAPNAKIAAHDIGALGYFGGREILDLAGLISPEVIPIIRDEVKLAGFISEFEADYLFTFKDWYEILPRCGELVFQSPGEIVTRFGHQNMGVYRWEANCTLP
jgi:hypothetical protein